MKQWNAQWIDYMDAYRIYDPETPWQTIAYEDTFEDAKERANAEYNRWLVLENGDPDKKHGWLDYLPEDVAVRLCECRSEKSDLPVLVNAEWSSIRDSGAEGWTKEDALIRVLEYLDCNGQDFGDNLTADEYNVLARDVSGKHDKELYKSREDYAR